MDRALNSPLYSATIDVYLNLINASTIVLWRQSTIGVVDLNLINRAYTNASQFSNTPASSPT